MAQYVELRDEDSLTSAYKMFSGQGSEQPPRSVDNSPVPGLSAVQFGKLQNYFTGGISDKVLRDTLTQFGISDVDSALAEIKKAGSK